MYFRFIHLPYLPRRLVRTLTVYLALAKYLLEKFSSMFLLYMLQKDRQEALDFVIIIKLFLKTDGPNSIESSLTWLERYFSSKEINFSD